MSETPDSTAPREDDAPRDDDDREGPADREGEPGDDEADEPEGSAPGDEDDRLLPAGNPPRLLRGLAALVTGSLLTFVLMAIRTQLRWGVPACALGVAVATFGALDLLGTFDDPADRVVARVHAGRLARPTAVLATGALGLLVLVTLAVAGYLSVLASAILVPAAFLVTVVGVYGVGDALGAWPDDPGGVPRSMLQRHGFWLVVLMTLVYLPMLGSHSLSDPWETHYGEVSREILARNDWISLWWAQDGWFWSKPVLDFWLQALAMATFGVRYLPGEMLSAVAEGREPWPEWAVRLPIFLLTLAAVYLLYKGVAKAFGRRAGLLGGVVLITMPQWFLLTHQTMTDMPFVASMTAAMGLFLLAAQDDPERTVRVREIVVGGLRLRVSAYHLVVGAILACALPQALYLFSRNVAIDLSPLRIALVADTFSAGSAQNCGTFGNEACRAAFPVSKGLSPALQGLIWAQTLAVLLYVNWGERRTQRLYYLAAWLFAAIATMGKGPAGIGLPVLAALLYIGVTRRWRDLLAMEIACGLLIFLAVAMPWFAAMSARHGQPFTDRLLFHDMFKRAFTHVHDTNEGDDVSFRFYVWQLGYAMFPWTGLVPAGLVYWLRRREDDGDRRTSASIFLAMWFLVAFALFSMMLTKFHHYILPALPPAAMLTGVVLDAMMRRRHELHTPARRHESALLGAAAVAGAMLVFVVGRDLAQPVDGRPSQVRLLHLITYNYKRLWPPSLDFTTALWVFVALATALTLLLVAFKIRRHVVVALAALGLAWGAWGLDVYMVRTAPHWGQRETILAYHRANVEAPGPIVAYQMNWKGENFYTGNKLPAFVSSGKKFTQWIDEQKKKGAKVFYFVTEHNRTGTLSNELGTPRFFDKLTTPELNNKFVLVRARFE